MNNIKEDQDGIYLNIPDNATDDEVEKLIDNFISSIIGDFDTPIKHEDN